MKTSLLCLTFLTSSCIHELYPILTPVQGIVFGNDCSSEKSSSDSFMWPGANHSAPLRVSDHPWNGNNVCPTSQDCGQRHSNNTQNGFRKGEELYKCSGLLFFLNLSYTLIPKLLGLDDFTIKLFISETQQMPDANTFSPLRI